MYQPDSLAGPLANCWNLCIVQPMVHVREFVFTIRRFISTEAKVSLKEARQHSSMMKGMNSAKSAPILGWSCSLTIICSMKAPQSGRGANM